MNLRAQNGGLRVSHCKGQQPLLQMSLGQRNSYANPHLPPYAPTQTGVWQSLRTFPCQLVILGKLLNCFGPLNSKVGMLLSEELGCEINECMDAQQGAE